MNHRSLVSSLLALCLVAAACTSVTAGQATPSTVEHTTSSTAASSNTTSAKTADTEPSAAGSVELETDQTHGVGDPLYPDAGAAGLDVQHYDLAIDTTGGQFSAVASIDTVVTDPAMGVLSFDLVGLTVTAATLNGADAEFAQSATEVNIANDGSSDAAITIAYEGKPMALDAGIGLGVIGWTPTDWGSFVVSEPTGAPTWFPVNDHPSDKATFTMTVTVDDGLTAVGPGPLLAPSGNTFTFAPAEPMAPYLLSLAIGEFDVTETTGASGVAVKVTSHPLVEDVAIDIDTMILRLEALFGPYPLDSYGYVVVPEQLGFALENQTLSLFDLGTYRSEQIHVHELAHQWFGDYLSPAEWDDVWLNEGFATWIDTWWDSAGDFSAFDRLAAEVPPSFLGPLRPESTDELFGASVYVRGALTLEALRRTIGRSSFESLLREWLARYGGGTASTEDFIALVGELEGSEAADLVTEWVEAELPPALPAL